MNLPNIEFKSNNLPNNNLNYFVCSAVIILMCFKKFILLFYAFINAVS